MAVMPADVVETLNRELNAALADVADLAKSGERDPERLNRAVLESFQQ